MTKTIAVIGAGISGLSVLHFLREKYSGRDDIDIRLFEKGDYVGGTIKTQQEEGYLFETGPNAFLPSHESTFALIDDLDLSNQLLTANSSAKQRYLCVNNRLVPVPMDPVRFMAFPLLTASQKVRIFAEPFIRRGNNPDETIYQFAVRRFGRGVADMLLDPMVSGIYAGDIKKLNLRATFPKLYELEDKSGSIIKGLLSGPRQKPQFRRPRGLYTFRGGMGQIIRKLADVHQDSIRTGEEVQAVTWDKKQFSIHTKHAHHAAQEIFLCTPAYAASNIVRGLDVPLSQALSRIVYAPMAVMGLAYLREKFPKAPDGFGYLTPSSQGKKVLGIIFESQIFDGRAPNGRLLLRVMIGGAHHPDVAQTSRMELLATAVREISDIFDVTEKPEKTFFSFWPTAIPQYNTDYPAVKDAIENSVQKFPGLHLVANYLNGVSFNDCILNAKNKAQLSSL